MAGSYYEPFKDRLRGGPAVTADCDWALEEAASLILAASIALSRLGYRAQTSKLVQLASDVRGVRTGRAQ